MRRAQLDAAATSTAAGHLMRTRPRPMRPIRQAPPARPAAYRANHACTVCRVTRTFAATSVTEHAVLDHRQHRLIPLLRHAQLPQHRPTPSGSRESREERRQGVKPQPRRCQPSAETVSTLSRCPIRQGSAEITHTIEPTRGLEPRTARLQVECATNCATPAGHGNTSRHQDRWTATSPSLHPAHRTGPGTVRAGIASGAASSSTPSDEQHGRRPVGRDPAPRQGLLDRDQPGDDGHPDDAHDAQREQRRHQRPAAADAPGAVASRPSAARPTQPSRHDAEQEPERAAALAEADVLERASARRPPPRAASRPRPTGPRGPTRARRPPTRPSTAASAKATSPAPAHVTR